jgi:hypothetical protein
VSGCGRVASPNRSHFDTVRGAIEDGHVWTHGLGEQRRYALQHALGYQIWELDQPHFMQAHGRSLTGYEPSGAERDDLVRLRERFTVQARLDDD